MPELPRVPPVRSATKETPQLVMGKMPDSLNEWYVALALDKLKLYYWFQVALGDPGLRGGQTIDFIVWLGMGGIPVFIQGAHWHTQRTESEDLLKQAAAEHHYRNKCVLLSEEETSTRDRAYRAVIEKIGV